MATRVDTETVPPPARVERETRSRPRGQEAEGLARQGPSSYATSRGLLEDQGPGP